MPMRVEQPASMEPGRARLVGRLAASLEAETLEMAIVQRQTGSPQHLDVTSPTGWSPDARWFRPDAVAVDGQDVRLEVDTAVTWRLKPYQAYDLRFRDGTGAQVEDRVSWSAIRLPSSPPPVVREAAPEPSGSSADPLDAFADLAANAETQTVDAPQDPPKAEPRQGDDVGTKHGRSRWAIAAAAAVVVLAGAGLFAFLQQEAEPPVPLGVPLTLEGARQFLADAPDTAGAVTTEAERFAAGAAHDGAFLLYRFAARQGDAAAALALARYYDPESFDAERGPVQAADVDTAVEWYEQAAEAGDVTAMLRAGELLRSGQTTRSDAPERALFWLRKAADAGNETARELIQ